LIILPQAATYVVTKAGATSLNTSILIIIAAAILAADVFFS
jgi:hypothetical protein